MNFKNALLFFGICFAILVPVKIYSAISAIEFVESTTFLVIFGIVAVALGIGGYFIKTPIKNIAIEKNIILGVFGALVSASFFWCISAYFNDTATKYDGEWQPTLICILSILSFISFLLFSISHFCGKNILSKVPFFIYCPVLWFCVRMSLFLSMNISHNDPYVVITTGLFALFMVYYTQTFATTTESNNLKILFVFGLPTILFSAVTNTPVILNAIFKNDFVESALATSVLEIIFAIYILLTFLEAQKQIENHKETVIISK